MKSFETTVANYSGTFPNTQAVNATGAGSTNGTEWIAVLINEWWGFHQALMNEAMLTPNGVQEAPGASQLVGAIRIMSGNAGEVVAYSGANDPSVNGLRLLTLAGQVITIANYAELVSACYCGDALNATAPAYYKTSDAGGTTRSTSGAYMVLPDFRGLVLRGYDAGAVRDPDGATRQIGSIQADGLKTHTHDLQNHTHGLSAAGTSTDTYAHSHTIPWNQGGSGSNVTQYTGGSGTQATSTDTHSHSHTLTGSTDTPSTNTTGNPSTGILSETRMVNASVRLCVRY